MVEAMGLKIITSRSELHPEAFIFIDIYKDKGSLCNIFCTVHFSSRYSDVEYACHSNYYFFRFIPEAGCSYSYFS
jgi:hypothetical protein